MNLPKNISEKLISKVSLLKRRGLRRNFLSAAVFVALLLLLIVDYLPTLWGLSTSFKYEDDVFETITSFFPKRWTLTNYSEVFSNPYTPILRWFFNSVKIVVTYVFLYLLITSLASFGFTRLRFKGRETLFWICLSSMMVPGVINMIPNYAIIYRLNLIDNMFAMVLPGLSGVFGVFLLRQFMTGIPREYDEAAKIDGAGKFRIYFHIILPMCVPALVTLAIFSFQGNWNDYIWPLMVTNQPETRTLTAGMSTFIERYAHQYGKLMAGAMASAIPVLLVFLVGQKYFIRGISIGGIKG